jgi:hypothetical protein
MSPNKGGQILRLEPEGIELLEACPEIMQKFVQGENDSSFVVLFKGIMKKFQCYLLITSMGFKIMWEM